MSDALITVGRVHREVGITYRWSGDGDAPGDGDVLMSSGGSIYLIVEACEVKVRVPADGPKLRLRCLVIAADEVPTDAGIFELIWDSRTRQSVAA